jgi:hypothetical protein
VGIAAACVVMSIQRGVQVFNNEQQKQIYNGIVDTNSTPPTLGNMNLDATKGNDTQKAQAAVNQALLGTAVADLLLGA